MFYSLPQFLTFAIDPWSAVLISTGIIMMLSAGGMYQLLKEQGYSGWTCGTGVVLLLTSGFFSARIFYGHLNFQSYLLIAPLIYLLTTTRLNDLQASLLGSLLGAYFVHSGSHFICFIALFAVLPSLFILGWKLKRVLLTTFGALVLSAGKLYAVFRHMELFPRTSSFDTVSSISEVLALLVSSLLFPGYYEPFKWGAWEYNNQISLLAVPFIIIGIFSYKKVIPVLLLLFTVFLATGYEPVVMLVDGLPVVSSLRVNIRLLGALLFPLILFAARGLELKPVLGVFVIIGSIYTAHNKPQPHNPFDSSVIRPLYQALKTSPLESLRVNKIVSLRRDDISALTIQATNKSCFPINFDKSFFNTLQEGPITKPEDLMNPACMMFARENNCKPGDRIKSEENLDLLLSWKKPGWKSPELFNKISYYSLICIVGGLVYIFLPDRSAGLKRFVDRLSGS